MKTLRNFYNGKRVLITGHTGFKGAWLAYLLASWGADVTGVSLAPHTEPNLFSILRLSESVTHHTQDILDYPGLLDAFTAHKPEIIFHLAAHAIVRDAYDTPKHTHETNILGTVHVLEAIRATPSVKAGVIVTTDKVYANAHEQSPARRTGSASRHFKESDPLGGVDPYSASKAAADIVTTSYISSFFSPNSSRTLIAIARSGNVIGGGDWGNDRLVPDLIRSVFEQHKPLIIRNPAAIRPWEFVLEPLYGYLLLGRGLFVGDAAMSSAWNFSPAQESYITVETLIKESLAILGRGKGSYTIISSPEKKEAPVLKLDNSKARKLLGWRPLLNIQWTLQWTLKWYSAYYMNREEIKAITKKQMQDFFDL
ncbi:MAG: CDP-glucose 4,6-dehydratase [Parcubacteria group bacterium GW2011_GWA2_47_8]|nr:MAG: CDP-glucose 4,6-dehydratase [Parcubacteria group bacterium GW2011_GWA2_47_8]